MKLTGHIVLAALAAFPAQADTLVATRVIRANAIITPADVAVSASTVPGALPADADITGLEARSTIYPGRPIMPSHIGPAAVVTRNQTVSLVFRSGSLSIATEGRSLGRAAAGDVVRVMNLASRNTVVGRVLADGRVEVSTEGSID